MKLVYCIVAAAAVAVAGPALAQSKHGSKEEQEDAKRHRIMAAAHQAAAKCLEQLRKDCKASASASTAG